MSYANGNCVEVVMNGGDVYTLDAKDRSQGPVDVVSAEEYYQRQELAKLTGDSREMFSEPTVAERFSAGELQAYGAYIVADQVALLEEGKIVTAHENPELWEFRAPAPASESVPIS